VKYKWNEVFVSFSIHDAYGWLLSDKVYYLFLGKKKTGKIIPRGQFQNLPCIEVFKS
jgi:hypothetical protein